MKALFINRFTKPDYLNDCMLHGFCNIGIDLEVTNNPSYMLKSFPNKSMLYGKGFTIFGTLDEAPKISEDVRSKIIDKYYDVIIYGSVHRDRSFSDIVLSNYSKDKILAFDGEDSVKIYEPFVELTTYFKRENVTGRTDVNSISFSIPEEKIIQHGVSKTKMYATVVPGDLRTYVFNDEKSYYDDYASSYYGYTWKKGGWDCMRHYEILASGCIPAFRGLEDCPTKVMASFPKELILEVNEYSLNGKICPGYDETVLELKDHLKTHLTTKVVASKTLSL